MHDVLKGTESKDTLSPAEAERLSKALVNIQSMADSGTDELLQNFKTGMKEAGKIADDLERSKAELAIEDAYMSSLERHKVDVDSARKQVSNLEHIYQEGFNGDAASGLRSLVEGTTLPVKNKQRNLDIKWRQAYQEQQGLFLKDLETHKVDKLFRKGDFKKEIIKEIYNRGIKGFKSQAIPEVQLMADSIQRLNDRLFNLQKKVNSTIKYREGYTFSQALDPTIITKDTTAWVEDMLSNLDLNKTYNHGISVKEATKILFKEAADLGDVGGINDWMGGVRQYIYKNGESFADITDKWGSKDLFSGIAKSIENSTKKAALTEIFGNKPMAAYKKLKKTVESTSKNQKNVTAKLRKVEDAMDYFTGVGNIPGEGVAGWAFKASRAANQMSSLVMLGAANFSAILDITQQMAVLHKVEGTHNPIANMGKVIHGHITALTTKGADLEDLIGVNMDESIGHLLELSPSGAYTAGMYTKGIDLLFKVTGMGMITKQNRKAAAITNMRALQNIISEKSTNWNLQQSRIIEGIGLTPEEVSFLKTNTTKDLGLTPKMVDDIGGPEGLSDKLRLYYQDTVDSASPIPNAITMRQLGRHIPQDDYRRTAYELGTLFTSTLHRGGLTTAESMRAYTPNGSLVSYNSVALAASLAVRGGIVHYLASTAKDAARGRPYKELTAESFAHHIVGSGLGGLYVDMLFKAATSRKGLGSPSIDMVRNMVSAASDDGGVELKDFVNHQKIMGSNIWLWPAFQTHILNNELESSRSRRGRKTRKSREERRR